jgi:hypothetical protein
MTAGGVGGSAERVGYDGYAGVIGIGGRPDVSSESESCGAEYVVGERGICTWALTDGGMYWFPYGDTERGKPGMGGTSRSLLALLEGFSMDVEAR